MKRIIKRQEPQEFSDWKIRFRQQNGRDPAFSDFRETEEWSNLGLALLEEQGYICCYCMARISTWDSHIEHFIPRDIENKDAHSIRAKNVQLDYLNLFKSCNGEHGHGDHCGRYKDNENNPMLISPIEENIEDRFIYNCITGEIDAKDPSDQEAMTTIRILNLNTKKLREHRASAFYSSGVLAVETDEEREQMLDVYSSRVDGAFVPYCAALIWALKHID